jgi:hypothetical protein
MTTAILSDDERRALTHVLNAIIPPSADERLPGAGEVGVVDHIEEAVRKTPELKFPIDLGLAKLNELAETRRSTKFTDLAEADRAEILKSFVQNDQGLLATLTFFTYVGYYQNARVVEALGIEPRPPHPQGYEMAPTDWSLLDAVRQRGKVYRE